MPSGLHCSYRWGINDSDSLDDLLLVRLGARTVEVADNRGHTSLVAHGGSQVDGLLGVVLGEAGGELRPSVTIFPLVYCPSTEAKLEESKAFDQSTLDEGGRARRVIWRSCFNLRLDLATVSGSPLAGQVGQRAMTGSLELTVRHDDSLECSGRDVVVRVGVGWVG